MTGEDLHATLVRAAGAPDDRPGLDGLWTAGRLRRLRTRVAGAAAVVVVAALVGGAVALAAGGEPGEDVVAGPTGETDTSPPPPEPADGLVVLELDAGPVEDGLPTAVPGEAVRITYGGLAELFERGRAASWERWDGKSWVEEHVLVTGDGEGGGGAGGSVLPPDAAVELPEEVRTGPGSDLVPTPDDLHPGWYRICVPMRSPTEGTIAGTVPAGAGPEVTAPPETHIAAGEEIRPCAQLRVPSAETGPAPGPDLVPDPIDPPPEPQQVGPDTLVVVDDGPATPNTLLDLELDTPQGATLGSNTTWEQWDGARWVPTHLYENVLEPRPKLLPLAPVAGVDVLPPDVAIPVDPGLRSLFLPIPGAVELLSPWSRVCVDTSLDDELRPCVEVDVEEAPATVAFGFGADDEPEPTHPASWAVDPASPPAPDSTTVDVIVTQESCSGGELREPEVATEADHVIIRIDAEQTNSTACSGTKVETVTVELGGTLGERRLVDGACGRSDARLIEACADGAQRWPLDR